MHRQWDDKTQSSDKMSEAGGSRSVNQDDFSSMVISSNRSKYDHLPRLRLQEERNDGDRSNSKISSMSERLERMRIEDRRRAKNEEARRLNSSKMRAEAPSFQPISNSTSSSSSASSRAGTSFYASRQLSRRENSEADRMFELRRKFAGPVPPSSWTNKNNSRSDDDNMAVDDGLEIIDVSQTYSRKISRYRVLTAARLFFEDNNVDQQIGNESSVPDKLNSLLDLSLMSIINYATDENSIKSNQIEQQISDLPIHLKERALSLAGRYAKTRSVNAAALSAFFKGDDGDDDEIRESCTREEEDEEMYDQLPEDWENDSNSINWNALATFTTLDLSFADISIKSLRTLLNSPLIQASHIRSLSLSGWGYGEEVRQSSQMRIKKCLRTSTTLMNILEQMTNLQFLSLAATKLLPVNEDWFNKSKTMIDKDGKTIEVIIGLSPETASEALAFLKKLARRTNKLQTLDLSACRWINGAVISNLGWYSTSIPIRRLIWPRLQNLILSECPAFVIHPEKVDDLSDEKIQIRSIKRSFAGSWHSSHHGILTESPYFLSHKPGLGRALLAHGIGAWDSVTSDRRTHALVGREATALAHHHGHVRQARRLEAIRRGRLENEISRSAFDDESLIDLNSIGSAGIHTGFAISHGVAPFAGRREDFSSFSSSSSSSIPSWSLPPRCPVSGKRVERHEWERARVLDSVNGRWGSAIIGTIEEELDMIGSRRGSFINVYFSEID